MLRKKRKRLKPAIAKRVRVYETIRPPFPITAEFKDEKIKSKKHRINYLVNEELIDKYHKSPSPAKRKECLRVILKNFNALFNKYINLIRDKKNKRLTRDTLLFISLFYAGKTAGELVDEDIKRTCKILKSISQAYSDSDLISEFHIIAIDIINKYRRLKKSSFTNYFTKLFRYRVADMMQKALTARVGYNVNIYNYNDDIWHHTNKTQDVPIDIKWVLHGGFGSKHLTINERFILYKIYVEHIPHTLLVEKYGLSRQDFPRILNEIKAKYNIEIA